jgi:hypothetical protein
LEAEKPGDLVHGNILLEEISSTIAWRPHRHRKTDTLKISASITMDTENVMKRYFIYGVAPMQWDKYFMSLEDASGKVVATWLGADDCT